MKLGDAFDVSRVPENYFPAALSFRQGAEPKAALVSVFAPGPAPVFGFAPIAALAEPAQLWRFLNCGAQDRRSHYIGPQTQANTAVAAPIRAVESTGRLATNGAKPPSYVAVIDVGLVPWLRYCGHHFQAISHLDLDDPGGSGAIGFKTWPADTPGLDFQRLPEARRMAAMAQAFPASIFATRPASGSFLHGVAMTDLVCGLGGSASSDTKGLFGIELPAAILDDPSGKLLQGILPAAINQAVVLTQDHAETPQSFNAHLEIVLAFGFTGGPHGPGHRFAALLAETLSAAQANGVTTRLHLPMGNHQQEKLHAVLVEDQQVNWHLPYGDSSANTIEFTCPAPSCSDASATPRVTLTAPNSDPLDIPLRPGEGRDILHEGAVIGSHYVTRFDDDTLKAVLCLGATRPRDRNVTAAPHGQWRLGYRGPGDLRAWILRDDTSSELGQGREQSHFSHRNYRERIAGKPASYEDDNADCPIKRAGSASVLAVAAAQQSDAVFACGAMSTKGRLSPYSGVAQDGTTGEMFAVDDGDRGRYRVQLAANGRRGRIRGTSAAAAISAFWASQQVEREVVVAEAATQCPPALGWRKGHPLGDALLCAASCFRDGLCVAGSFSGIFNCPQQFLMGARFREYHRGRIRLEPVFLQQLLR